MKDKIQEIIQQGLLIARKADTHLEQAIHEFNKWKFMIINQLEHSGLEPEKLSILKVMMHYKKNMFDESSSKNNLIEVIEKTNTFLEALAFEETRSLSTELDKSAALIVIKRILANFYLHIKAMYKDELHGRGTIQQDNLDAITMGNEYDVQRLLYALFKPIFPNARLEKNDDTGYGGIRYDIVIESFDVIIEVKCSRSSMTEKKLTEEIGADICHYQASHLFFFIYDKECMIKNPEVFQTVYTKNMDGKEIETYVIQPVIL
ncbi:MAG: hypothetical protein ACRC1P_06215 [Cellulosilyticaceae bacterium]